MPVKPEPYQLKRARLAMKFSVGDVCLRADVSRDVILRAERGDAVPPDAVKRIATALHLVPKEPRFKKALETSPPSHLRERFARYPLKP